MNYLGEYKNNLILILNDNDQRVAENHGGLYRHLKELRETKGKSEHNLFKCLGLPYYYLEDGHDTQQLVPLLKRVKDTKSPVVLHIHTIKGKGLDYAERDKENWHSGAPFFIENGEPRNGRPIYDTTIHDSLADLLTGDKKTIVLTAGTPRALGFVEPERSSYAQTGRFVDVGIAEQNAMGMSDGVARYGGNAVFGVYSPFLQRAYDQLSHDICLNHSAATILVLLPGAYGMKSNTHLGIRRMFDMNIQSLSVCVPAKKCINDCKFCCSKMHTADYEDYFSDVVSYSGYSDDMRKRLEYARDNGCNTCMLTGNNEPQQNKDFLRVFSEINKTLRKPFYNIEMQTSGAFITPEFLDFSRTPLALPQSRYPSPAWMMMKPTEK